MNTILNNILEGLRAGNVAVVYDNKEYLNDLGIHLYTKNDLDYGNIHDLKDLLTICNIVYNDTDKELMVIEDGFYDQLLELYKRYDPHFQVGAEVLKFKPSTSLKKDNKLGYIERPLKQAVIYNDNGEDFHYADDILISPVRYMDYRDLVAPNPLNQGTYIGKRIHDVAHNHPELVGTLDKCKFVYNRQAMEKGVFNDPSVKIVERDFFGVHMAKGILNPHMPFDMVLELKYDGISIEADCTDVVVSARSRGDTGVGKASDMTPILAGYRFPHRTPGSPMVGVKFEAIITKDMLPLFNRAKGYEYKNCRSAIVGLFSSSDAWKYRDFITLVPLAVEENVYRTVCNSDRVLEIHYLNSQFVSHGCPLRYSICSGDLATNLRWIDLFVREAEQSRDLIPFMYDGVVISYLDDKIRQKLGRENFINKYSMAIKFEPMLKRTTFRAYSYTVGQDGSITPMIHFDPVEFLGTIHTKSSGHSYARFLELELCPGDTIDVEYRNDVMPYVTINMNDEFNTLNHMHTKPIEFPKVCPICGSNLVFSDKSAKCVNPNCGGKALGRLVNMCAKLGLYGFGEATILKLRVSNIIQLVSLFYNNQNMKSDLFMRGFGPVETMNMYNEIHKLLTEPLYDTVLLGSIGFTDVSIKTWELILSVMRYEDLRNAFMGQDRSYRDQVVTFLSSINGIGPRTIATIEFEFPYFVADIEYMFAIANIKRFSEKGKNTGKKVIATGFRDRELFDELNKMGFNAENDGSLTKDTAILLVPSENFVSSKVEKAKKYGTLIVPVNEFRENASKYL